LSSLIPSPSPAMAGSIRPRQPVLTRLGVNQPPSETELEVVAHVVNDLKETAVEVMIESTRHNLSDEATQEIAETLMGAAGALQDKYYPRERR